MAPFILDPGRVFETKGEVAPVLSVGGLFLAGANQQVVAAVTDKKIRVMGWIAQSDDPAGVATMVLKSASGGTALMAQLTLAASPAVDKQPIAFPGYFSTNSGEGLFVDITTNGVYLTVFYILCST
jgi:hypothetical protein